MGFLNILGDIAGVAGAPFTGGASLAIPALNLGTGIANTIIGGKAIGNASRQQLGGIADAQSNLEGAEGSSEGVVKQGQQGSLDAQYEGLGSILGNLGQYQQTGGDAAKALDGYQAPDIPLGKTAFNFDPSKVTEDPGSQFIMDQAAQTLSRSAAGRGALRSGGTVKDTAQYLTGLGSTLYGQAYNRQFQNAQQQYQTGNEQNVQQFNAAQRNAGNQFNRLSSLSSMGLSATGNANSAINSTYGRISNTDEATANNIANLRSGLGANLGNLNLQAGNVRANATLGKANNLTAGIGNAGYSLGQMYSKPAPGATEDLGY